MHCPTTHSFEQYSELQPSWPEELRFTGFPHPGRLHTVLPEAAAGLGEWGGPVAADEFEEGVGPTDEPPGEW